MIASLNELQSLVKAAARGAGLFWGEAVECAGAARWLAAHGIDAVPACAARLQAIARTRQHAGGAELQAGLSNVSEPDGAPVEMSAAISAKAGPLCPYRTGMMLSDFAYKLPDLAPVSLNSMAQPVLLVPFLAQAAATSGALQLSGGGFCLTVCPQGWTGTLPAGEEPAGTHGDGFAGPLSLALVSRPATLNGWSTTRVTIQPDDHRILTGLAALTYAPATCQSRLSGAGAGLLDND